MLLCIMMWKFVWSWAQKRDLIYSHSSECISSLQAEYLELGAGEGTGVGPGEAFTVVDHYTDTGDTVNHNWTEIILAFTFTVTVVLIFILWARYQI